MVKLMQRINMADVARAAGVSKNTVSLALRGSSRLPESTRRRIVELAESLGYRPSATVAHLMAELRQIRQPRYQATLGLLNVNEDKDAFSRHPTIPAYVEGCRRRAAKLGYALDEFWLMQRGLPVERWMAMLRTRNIRGLLAVGLMQSNRLPDRFLPLWENFPTVVTGVRTREPELSFACTDHHALALAAFEKAVALGYKRPALVLDPVIDRLVEGRFTAGFLTGQRQHLPQDDWTEPFHEVSEARNDVGIFAGWLEKARPDVIFTLYHEVARWLQKLGKQVPRDIGLIQYEWRSDHSQWAGMDQRNDLVGEAAVDMVISMIHHNMKGVPDVPLATLVGSKWVGGETVRRHPSGDDVQAAARKTAKGKTGRGKAKRSGHVGGGAKAAGAIEGFHAV